MNIDLSKYKSDFSVKNKIVRVLWNIVYVILFRPFSLPFFRKWRIFLLNSFSAKVSYKSLVHSSARVWGPWNLVMEEYSCMGKEVDCYNQGLIVIKKNAVVSQKTYLCASSHDISSVDHTLIKSFVIIEEQAWVAADAFIGPGVTIGKGAVVGARSAVFKDVEPWAVVGGNPAKFIKKRVFNKP
jgi:putative colanic acid biosynthesis acetyltransferase WcaF